MKNIYIKVTASFLLGAFISYIYADFKRVNDIESLVRAHKHSDIVKTSIKTEYVKLVKHNDINEYFKDIWYGMDCVPIKDELKLNRKINNTSLKCLCNHFESLIKNHNDIVDEESVKEDLYHRLRFFMTSTLGLSSRACEELFDESYYDCK